MVYISTAAATQVATAFSSSRCSSEITPVHMFVDGILLSTLIILTVVIYKIARSE